MDDSSDHMQIFDQNVSEIRAATDLIERIIANIGTPIESLPISQ